MAGADWQSVRHVRPPKPELCADPKVIQPPRGRGRRGQPAPAPQYTTPATGDRWIQQEFAATVLDLATAVRLDARGQQVLREALAAARYARVTVTTKVTRLFPGGGIGRSTLGRTEACPVLTAHLQPLLEPAGYARWLEELAATQLWWRGGSSRAAVPRVVAEREMARDRDLARRWVGAPPAAPPVPAGATELQRTRLDAQHRRQVERFEEEQRRVRAFLPSDPNALTGIPEAPTPVERRRLEQIGRAAQANPLPVIELHGAPVPANLFVAEAAEPIRAYLDILAPVLRVAPQPASLAEPLIGVAYGVLAAALVPIHCLYDEYHGTCVVEQVIPRLLGVTTAMEGFAARTLPRIVRDRLRQQLVDPDDQDAARLLSAFARWVRAIAEAQRRAIFALLRTVGEQSAGRSRTPTTLASGGRWRVPVQETMADGSIRQLQLEAEESLSYEPRAGGASARDADPEIFWLMADLWPPLGTAVALANQSGARIWINAANNRWGGHHPPHRTHRQGYSLDVDAGFVWAVSKVSNVVKRDYVGLPLSEQESAGNSGNAECLKYMERIAGWIVTQAFVIAGVSQYLYGDAALVELASMHLAAHFDVARPARMDGVIDAAGHNDHWHFEMIVGPRPGAQGDFVWQVKDPALLDTLHALAAARDADPAFWEKFAGLDAVPTQESDFDGIQDEEHWKRWFRRRSEPCGTPLLPVWAPQLADRTFQANSCWAPKGDFPEIFQPGEGVPT